MEIIVSDLRENTVPSIFPANVPQSPDLQDPGSSFGKETREIMAIQDQ